MTLHNMANFSDAVKAKIEGNIGEFDLTVDIIDDFDELGRKTIEAMLAEFDNREFHTLDDEEEMLYTKCLEKAAATEAERRNRGNLSLLLAGELGYKDIFNPQRNGKGSRQDRSATLDFHGVAVLPIMAANMHGVGTMDMARAGIVTALEKNTYTEEDLIDFFLNDPAANLAFYTIGTRKENPQRNGDSDYAVFKRVLNAVRAKGGDIKNVCIDVPHGGTDEVIELAKKVKVDLSEDSNLMAGNIIEPSLVMRLAKAGVNLFKIGVGPGGQCTTSTTTGVSRPQLSAVIATSYAVRRASKFLRKELNVCADGGVKENGDIMKAIGVGGAKFAMIGTKLIGYDQGGVVNFTKAEVTADPEKRTQVIRIIQKLYERGDFDNFNVKDASDIKKELYSAFVNSGLKEALEKEDARFENNELQIRARGSSSARHMKANGGQAEHQAAEGRDDQFYKYKGGIETLIKDIKGHIQSTLSYYDKPNLISAIGTLGFRIRRTVS